jgi:CRISPR-associated protein Csh1
MKDEIAEKAIKLYKDDTTSGGESRIRYMEIIEELWKEYKDELGNYYLLFTVAGEIKDFDFVSKFEFNLNADGSPWKIVDLYGTGGDTIIYTVSDLQTQVLPSLFNNALVVRRKDKDWIFRYFDDIDPQYCKTNNAFLMAMKYRKAFYDFIYKSKRQGVTSKGIKDILLTGIIDDIRLDDFKNNQHSEGYNIRTKLNMLFSLHQYFSNQSNPRFMANNIIKLRERIDAVAKGELQIETDDQFAFAAGQVIARIFWESQTGDQSYRYLEPFLAQSKAQRFKESISNLFKRYKHGVYSDRFRQVSAQVMTYDVEGEFRDTVPILLAGVFSKNQLFSDKDKDGQNQQPTSN